MMKFELIAPGRTLMSAEAYNAFFTLHGIIMIFAVVIPGLPAVFGNFFLPILIGARDVSFPRLNLLSWYFFAAGAAVPGTRFRVGRSHFRCCGGFNRAPGFFPD